MLEKSSSLGLDQLGNHIAQDRTDGVEALVSSANVVETIVIKQNLLHNEDGHGLAKLRARLHYAKTERNDLRRQEEVDDVGRIILDQSANNAEAGQSQVFERSRLGRRVEEGIEEQRNMRCGIGQQSMQTAQQAAKGDCSSRSRAGGGVAIRNSPFKNRVRVSLWDATHWSNARALQTRFEAAAVSCDGLRRV